MKRKKCCQGVLHFNFEGEERKALSISLFLNDFHSGERKSQQAYRTLLRRKQLPL